MELKEKEKVKVHGIALDPFTGNIHVSDFGYSSISTWTTEGKLLNRFGNTKGPGKLDQPTGLAVDSMTTNIFVVEFGSSKVSVFTTEGTYIRSFGSRGKAPEQFMLPWGIVIDKNGLMAIVDCGNDRVKILTTEGELLAILEGSPDGSFRSPLNPCLARDGKLLITDSDNNRISIFG